ncbi:hypothetical protein GCM10010411_90330 [Actinomadura fulvescens]|uniref:Uncharacterized protein n=1 Tax=Actinomadura fulvescens TaxID=46160 RepID=A0ABN3QWL1_9ACTN
MPGAANDQAAAHGGEDDSKVEEARYQVVNPTVELAYRARLSLDIDRLRWLWAVPARAQVAEGRGVW